MLDQQLVKLGLSEKEAKVYLASLELGPSPVQKISQRSKVNRATTYVVIEDLKAMGLMSTFDQGKKTYFVAEQPERLLSHLKSQESELKEKIAIMQEKLPELKSIFNANEGKPKVKYYEGIEGLKAVRRDFIETLKLKGGEVFAFLPLDEFDKIKPLFQEGEYLVKALSKIKFKVIYTSENGRDKEYEEESRKIGDEVVFVDYKSYPLKGGMNVYGDKVFLIDYLGKTGGIMIENRTLAKMFESIFLMTWNKNKR